MRKVNDLIYAYSLGCLDNEELQWLKEHLDDCEAHDIQELGEFQSLASLLPLTLKIENPDPQLKDNVAKKLYRLKEEVKAQREKNKPSLKIQEVIGEKELDSSKKEQEILIQENRAIKSNPQIESDVQKMVEGTNGLSNNREIPLIRPTVQIKKNYTFIIWSVVISILLAIGIIITYMNITMKKNDRNYEVEILKKEIGNLNIKLLGNQEILEMLKSPDVRLIDLKGTNFAPNSYGKLIIGFDKGAGYIKLAHMPVISEDRLFQLWLNIEGNYLSLKTIHGSDTLGFYSFKILNLLKGTNINFLITEETSSESTTPGDKVYLRGTFKP